MKDGGQAFPMHERDDALVGMSLRDYFAGRALEGLLSDEQNCQGILRSLQTKLGREAERGELLTQIANNSYAISDAMLAEREKEAK